MEVTSCQWLLVQILFDDCWFTRRFAVAHTIDEWSLVWILFDDRWFTRRFAVAHTKTNGSWLESYLTTFYIISNLDWADPFHSIWQLRKNMERLEQDLRYFMYELKRENNRLPRNLLLREVARVQQQILDLMREKLERMEWETRNMSALDIIRRPEKKK